jgi:hypothetical protein
MELTTPAPFGGNSSQPTTQQKDNKMTTIYKTQNQEITIHTEVLNKDIIFNFFKWTNEELQEMIDENGFDETVRKLGKNAYIVNITINGIQYERMTTINIDTEEYEIEPITLVLDNGDGYENLGSYITCIFEDNDDELQSRIILHESVTGFHNGELDHPVHVRWNRRTL